MVYVRVMNELGVFGMVIERVALTSFDTVRDMDWSFVNGNDRVRDPGERVCVSSPVDDREGSRVTETSALVWDDEVDLDCETSREVVSVPRVGLSCTEID